MKANRNEIRAYILKEDQILVYSLGISLGIREIMLFPLRSNAINNANQDRRERVGSRRFEEDEDLDR